MAGVEVQVWSDFACPWCALGLARLDAARRQFEHGDEVRVVHRSYELRPRARAAREETMIVTTTIAQMASAGHSSLELRGFVIASTR